MTAPPPAGPGATPTRTEGQGGLAGTLSEAAGQVKERVQDVASGVAGRVGDAWESTREGVQQGARYAARQAQDFWNDAGNLVRRNPMAAVALAFGIGCVVGLTLAASWRPEDDVAERMSRASA
jgi:ElaB/YqjD/DUF883 family membrane-anchored ribosome-binding protein